MTRKTAQPLGTMTSADLYRHAVEQGLDRDSHASDLYLRVTPKAQALIMAYKFRSNVTTFKSQIDGSIWYDIPFAYQPFWERAMRGRA